MNHDVHPSTDEPNEGTEELAPAVAALAGPRPDEPTLNGKGDRLRDDHSPERPRRPDDLSFPDPPSATRLNRLAVTMAAAVVSVMLLVIAFAVGGSGDEDAQARERDATSSRVRQGGRQGTFYDRPLRGDTLYSAVDPVTGLSEEEMAMAELATAGFDVSESGTLVQEDGALIPPPYGRPPHGSPAGPSPYGTSGAYQSGGYGDSGAPGSQRPPQPSPRVQALDRAKRSALAPQGVGGISGGAGPAPPAAVGPTAGGVVGASDAYDLAYLQALQGMTANAQPPPGAVNGMGSAGMSLAASGLVVSPGAAGGGMHPADRARQFVQGAVASRETGRVDGRYLATSVQRPVSPYEIREGTLVEAYLVTGVHSDLPGDVVAQVARNVFDSETQQVVLIPRGTRLVGTYDNAVALDQSRLLVAWTRMVFPDGRSVALPGLGSTGNDGMGGVPGRVNRHFFRAFGNAAMLALVGGSLSYATSQSQGPGGTFGYPSPGEVMAGSVATELSRVATEMLRGNVNRRPTITIPAGTRFSVFVSGDLALEPYAAADGFLSGR
ncbi:MAG: TrbI/VirB10 family protein [Rhodothermales bacterium]